MFRPSRVILTGKAAAGLIDIFWRGIDRNDDEVDAVRDPVTANLGATAVRKLRES